MNPDKAQSLLEKTLERAKAKGAVAADCVWGCSEIRSFSARDDKIERSRSSAGMSMGLRVLDSCGRQGVASLSDLDDDASELLCEAALQNASCSEPEDDALFAQAQPSEPRTDLGLYDQNIPAWNPDAQMKLCLEMSAQARRLDRRVKSVRSASVSAVWSESLIMNTSGVFCRHRCASGSIGLSLLAEDGDAVEIGGAGAEGRSLSSLMCCLPVEEAVERTVRMLGGSPLKTGQYRLVLEPTVTADLLEALADMFCASNVCKGFSLLAQKMGQQVASGSLTLVDDGRLYGGMGTSPFDSECVSTGRTAVLRDGVLSGWLTNLQYGARLGLPSTGNAVRSGASIPEVDISNFFVMPGARPWEDIVADNDGCFCVTELMGLHTIDSVTGDFSLAARGLLYKNGVFSPVSSVTIAGNLLDFLAKIGEIGGDLRFFGCIGGCTMVVDDIA
ncbi:MAG: TldD/PmbA family protein, partial [Pyramidobacter sp.]|nr:TldD/PmbA family protein [Pyramidobacter sp.]